MSENVTSTDIKFSEEEMNEVKFIQQKYQEKLLLFGQLTLDRIQAEDRVKYLKDIEEKIKTDYITIQKLEEEFLKKVTEKYGEGRLDAKTGIFKPESSKKDS